MKISVIVPIYKVEKYLPACIDSILVQTHQEFEIILVDDGSLDNCGALCDTYATRDIRIKAIHQENKGVSAARNAGLEIADGEYIVFIDPDDMVQPDMLRGLLDAIEESGRDIAACGNAVISETGEWQFDIETGVGIFTQEEALRLALALDERVGGSCVDKLFRRGCIEDVRFPSDCWGAEDARFLFAALLKSNGFCRIREKKYWIRQRPGSLTRNAFSRYNLSLVDAARAVRDLICRETPQLSEHAQCYTAVKTLYVLEQLAGDRELCQRYKEAYREMKRVLRKIPFQIARRVRGTKFALYMWSMSISPRISQFLYVRIFCAIFK